MRRVGFIIFFTISSLSLFSQKFYIELNQMFGLNAGVVLPITDEFGFKAALGTSIFSIKTITYSSMFYYELKSPWDNFSTCIELGLPIAYLDLWEEKFVDWDEFITSPYAGWLPGITLRAKILQHFLVQFGVSYWLEWQEYYGWKDGVIPILSVGYLF